jgi:hypothetical protein
MPGTANISWISGSPPIPANPIVQLITSASNRTDSATLSIGSVDGWATPTAGNLLVLCINSGSTINIPGGWARNVQALNQLEVSMYSKISAGNESTISATLGASGTAQGVVIEINGFSTFDQSSTNTVTSPITSVTFNATGATTAANEIIIAFAGMQDTPDGDLGPAIGWSNSFVQRAFTGVKSAIGGPPWTLQQGIATFVATSTGTFSTVFTFTNTSSIGEFYGIIGTYK